MMMIGQVESLRPFALLHIGLSRATLPKTVILANAKSASRNARSQHHERNRLAHQAHDSFRHEGLCRELVYKRVHFFS